VTWHDGSMERRRCAKWRAGFMWPCAGWVTIRKWQYFSGWFCWILDSLAIEQMNNAFFDYHCQDTHGLEMLGFAKRSRSCYHIHKMPTKKTTIGGD
jgi:hypothetical protein